MPPNELAPSPDAGALIESVITKGDLAKLSPRERTEYYSAVCKSVGLNPFTRPFEYLSLNGKLILYARRDAADQLRKINGISVEVVSRDIEDDLVVVHVKARDKTGRTDEDFGAVTIAGLRGEAKANSILKAITKAKRRVTLSISGLGFLDETEVDDIPVTERVTAPASVSAELDDFAAAPEPELAEPEPPHSGTPFDLPPHPSERSGPPTSRRAAIWRKSSYALRPDALLDGTPAWNQWALDLTRLIGEAITGKELNKLATDNAERLATLHGSDPDAAQRIVDAAHTRRAELHADALAAAERAL